METLNNKKSKRYFIIGVLLMAIGIISLVQNIGVFIPGWVISWHTILLTIGLLIGYRKHFKAGGWIILVFIGGLFTLQSILTISLSPYMFALVLIGLGLYLLLKPTHTPGNCRFSAENEH
ncbi:LiaF transmembrane domain-containing protein [Pedobacter immunditicola]|uniref:LiaF transmembrane domain-containing protein n=1 Tax=Pedobacter immunditicola TaxID=3133440 RepID=UPI00309A427F